LGGECKADAIRFFLLLRGKLGGGKTEKQAEARIPPLAELILRGDSNRGEAAEAKGRTFHPLK